MDYIVCEAYDDCGQYWSIRWSARLVPDQSMLPGQNIFLLSSQTRSLTATIEGTAALLPLSFNTCLENIYDLLNKTEEAQLI